MATDRRDLLDLSGRVALVTGASSGIGRTAMLEFARAGASVVGTGRNADAGAETVRMVTELGGQGRFVVADVADSVQVEQAVTAAVDAFGRLDYAFNNAGVSGTRGKTAELTEDNWLRVIDINLSGVWRCMRAEIPIMLAQGAGAIVNCSSALGLVALANSSAYVASKHAVIGLTKAAALEYATTGVRINAVSPGFVATPLLGASIATSESARAPFAAMEPMGRLGYPEEVARAVVWLCSDAASFVTGTSLVVDGGWIAGYRMQ